MKAEIEKIVRMVTLKSENDRALRELSQMLKTARSRKVKTILRAGIGSLIRPSQPKKNIDPVKQSARWKKKETSRKATNENLKRSANNSRQRWTDAHDKVVLDSAITDVQIGQKLGRSLLSIRNRRHVLRKVKP